MTDKMGNTTARRLIEKDIMWYDSPIFTRLLNKICSCEGYTLRKVSREFNLVYGHLFELMNVLEKIRIIKTERVGRNRLIHITKKGKEVSNRLYELNELIYS